jgi:hypothetical protein
VGGFPRTWLIYAGVPLVESLLVVLVASRSRSRLDNSLAVLWGLNATNFAASIAGVFGTF